MLVAWLKKTDFNAKITEVEGKIPSISGLATSSGLITVENKISDVSSLVKTTDFDAGFKKISDSVTSNKSKHFLVETELKKLKTFAAVYFRGKKYFDYDDAQFFLVFQPVFKYFKRAGFEIASWESIGLLNEKISSVGNSNGAVPQMVYDNAGIKVEFNGNFLKQDKVTYNHGPIVNIYIVSRLTPDTKDSSVTLQNCLFGSVKLTKNVDIDK